MATELFGLDKELAIKRAENYDLKLEEETRTWIEQLIGDSRDQNLNFQEYLKDGVALCKLVEKLMPELKVKPNSSKMPFKQMENINNFLIALDKLNVPKFEQFQTIDLYENKNMTAVLGSIVSFSRHAFQKGLVQSQIGPKLGK